MMGRQCMFIAVLASLGACAAADENEFGDDFEVEDQWTEECDTENDPDPEDCEEASARCTNSTQCEGDQRCVADFDSSSAEIGPLVCKASCIDNYDQASWCVDTASCCDPTAVCTGRGFCIPDADAGESTSSTGATSSESGSSSEESSGTGPDTSSSGSSESGGSESGGSESTDSESTGGAT